MTLRVFTELDDLPSDYVALFDAAERRSLFFGLDWFRLLAATALDDGQSVRLYGLEPEGGGTPRAALVAFEDGPGPGGHTISAFSNFYSMTYAPVVAPGEPYDAAIAELIGEICREKPRWDTIRFAPMDENGEAFDNVLRGLRQAGMITLPYFMHGNWFESVEGGEFEAFLKRRPSQLRNTYRRRRKKLEAESGVRYELITGSGGLESGLSAYQTIYALSWKEPERYPDFMPAFARLAAGKGWLRLGVIYIDDTPAAAQLWLVDGDRAVIYKLAYDERFKSRSVGTILTMYLMQHVIEVDKVREVDYGSGDDPYKKDWMSSRRERWGVIGYNPATIRGLAGGLAGAVARWFRTRGGVADSPQP